MNIKPLKLALIAGIITSLSFAPVALAGHNNHGNHHKHGGYNKHAYKKHHHNHYNKRHHRSHHRKHHHKAGHIIGGIIGGVVLSNIIHNAKHHHSSAHVSYNHSNYGHSNYRQASYGGYNKPVVVNKTIVLNNTPTQTYRVLNGTDCYLVNVNNNGSEILTQVPNVNCGF